MKKLLSTIGLMLILAGCSNYPAGTTTNTNNPAYTTPTSSETTTGQPSTPDQNLNNNLNQNSTSPSSGTSTSGTTSTSGQTQNSNSGSGQTANQTSSTTNNQTFQSKKYKFQFQYPQEFALISPTYGNLTDQIAQVEMNSSQYPNTNFNDAAFTVSASPASSSNQCLSMNKPEGSSGFTNSSTINGTKFYWTTGTGAGAGNLYDSKIYRTFKNNNCLEVSETIHTSNLANYTPGTVQEVDKSPIWKKLDSVLQTFKFTS